MHQSFSLEYPFYACKSFRCHGKTYSPGEVIPVKELDLTVRRIHQLLSTRKITQDFTKPLSEQTKVLELDKVIKEVKAQNFIPMEAPVPAPTKAKGRPKSK